MTILGTTARTSFTASADPYCTVSAKALARNLVFLGNLPRRIPASTFINAVDWHGAAYAAELFATLGALGYRLPAEAKAAAAAVAGAMR